METKYFFYSPKFPELKVIHNHKSYKFVNHLLVIEGDEEAKELMESPHYKRMFILQGKDDVLSKVQEKYPELSEDILKDERMLKYFKMEYKDLRKEYKKLLGAKDTIVEGITKKEVFERIYEKLNEEEKKKDE